MMTAKRPHGGARPGAGRPRKPPVLIDVGQHEDAASFLMAVMRSGELDMRLRIVATKALLRRGDVGRKEQATDAATKAAAGRFAPGRPPLKAVQS